MADDISTADNQTIVAEGDDKISEISAENDSALSKSPNQAEETVKADDINVDFLAEKPKIVYKLSDYEGPIELLYELIKAAKIPIEDIFISDITSQYVQIIKDTPKEELDYDYA